ncbi:MAG TPA: nicotinate-nicotinamide nucleotide adenylyltransferase [Myxococcales bacterium]|jgi:nicotinate-nucleotide adenylyltransferase|nr:nicotinate-nicotinamide nucleotide adenylyltransferase [Myxococcales bacterium]
MGEIALFGGSFDPPHVGHLLAATYVLATEPVDELWFVPVFSHPFQKPLQASFDHRVAFLDALVSMVRGALVSRIEQTLGGEGRTVDLLEYLHQTHPGTRFALVLGTDLDKERLTWKRWDRIQELARIIRISRAGNDGPEPRMPLVSSTEVRALLRSGGDASKLVPRPVLDAIRAAGTYR